MRGEAGGEGAADTALKTKTPHDNVGKKHPWWILVTDYYLD